MDTAVWRHPSYHQAVSLEMRAIDAWVPPQTGPLTLPGHLKSHFTENKWVGTTIARQKQSIFCPTVGDSVSVLSLSHTLGLPQVSMVGGKPKKDPGTISSPLPPLRVPLWLYPCLPLLHCHLSYHLKGSLMSSHYFPLIMSSRCLETPSDKSVASAFEIQKAQGLFF